MSHRILGFASLLAFVAALPQARGQVVSESDGVATSHSELQEVVVSARRKDELLTAVPASITAYGADFLQKQNIQDFVDYATRIPNVTFQYGQEAGGLWGASRQTTIRGVAGVGTTAYYINDTPVPSTVSPLTLDLERIEVLKGPQGTLFGASSMGGNLRFITKKPSLEVNTGSIQMQGGGTRSAGFDFDNEATGNFVVVPGRIAVDAALGYSHDSGISTRTFPDASGQLISKDDQGANDLLSASFELRGKITDSLEATLSFIGQSSYLHGFPAAYVPLPGYRALSYTEDRAQDVQEYSKDHWALSAFVLNYSAGGLSVVSSTSFFSRHLKEQEDDTEGTYWWFDTIGIPVQGSAIANSAFYNDSTVNSRLVTHESRLSFQEGALLPHLSGTVGVYYQHKYINSYIFSPPVPALDAIGLYPDYLGSNSTLTVGDEKAVFGEFYYEVVPKLTLTVGLRQYWMDQRNTPGLNSGFIFGLPYTDPPTSESQSGLIPKGVVSYKVGDEGNIYGSVSKGFRAGGANPALPALCDQDLADQHINRADTLQYRSDTLWNYEIGAKSRFRDGKLTASVAAFEMDWSKIQQQNLLPTCELGYQVNAGKARIRGGELELSGQPLGGIPLSIQLGLGYTDAKLIDPGVLRQAPNTRLNQVPEWTGTLSGYYETPITDRVHLFVGADYSYTDAVHVAAIDPSGYYLRQPFNMVNGNIGVSFGRHQVMLYGKNLLDKRLNFGDQVASGFDREELLPDGTYQRLPRAVVSRPRQLGLQYRVNF